MVTVLPSATVMVSVTVTTEGVVVATSEVVVAAAVVVVLPLAFAAAWKAANRSPGFTLFK